jgi:chaperonin GroEL
MAKLIKYDMKAREAMLNGVRTLADAVVVTFAIEFYLLNG